MNSFFNVKKKEEFSLPNNSPAVKREFFLRKQQPKRDIHGAFVNTSKESSIIWAIELSTRNCCGKGKTVCKVEKPHIAKQVTIAPSDYYLIPWFFRSSASSLPWTSKNWIVSTNKSFFHQGICYLPVRPSRKTPARGWDKDEEMNEKM